MNIFKRRDIPGWQAPHELVADYAARGVQIADLTGRLKAEESAHARTRHELAVADELNAELRKELLRKTEQIERQADVFAEYRTEIDQLKSSLSGTCEQLRQAHVERARAEREAAVAERLHRERRPA